MNRATRAQHEGVTDMSEEFGGSQSSLIVFEEDVAVPLDRVRQEAHSLTFGMMTAA